ncbi:MAG TPA: hypothetical protein VHZ96_06140 [Frankiaceae bacterium]|nr:hypothetical protein [Frankiaceae bacterium]
MCQVFKSHTVIYETGPSQLEDDVSLQHSDEELDDYSGPFEPDLRLTDFSKAGLMKLVEVGGSIYGTVNRRWYMEAIKRFGQEVADEMHHAAWFADGGAGDHENNVISSLMGFAGEDEVTTPLKVWQCLPAMSTRMTLTFEQTGDNEWEMYTPQCVVPEQGERGGPEALAYAVDKICGHLELFGFRHGAARWNPKIRIDPLKLPPRASADEPHCRWKITLTDENVDYASDPGAYVAEHNLGRVTDIELVNYEAGKYRRTMTAR